jgi:hypothetical protein
LIAGVAGAIVLGVFFTIHKLHSSHAEVAKTVPSDTSNSAPAGTLVTEKPTPTPAGQGVVTAVKSTPTPTSAPSQANTFQNDPDALVTSTPTSIVPPATQPGSSVIASNAQARADLPDLARRPTADFASPVTDAASHDLGSAKPAPSIPDAKTKADSGDPLATRQLLNEGLLSGHMSESDADAAKKQIDEINKTVIFSAKKFPEDPWGGTYQVASGERLATIAARNGVSWEFLSRVNGVTPKKMRSGQYIKIFKGPFYAIVYKHLFKMEIYLGAPGGAGSMYVTSFPVGLGKDNSTPTGLWMCKAGDKIRNPRYYPSRGGDIIAPEDPKNPLGGYWIAIEGLDGQAVGKESYGIHGTIDPSSIGKMESQGCIRLKAEDISWVFDILVDGKSKVLVKD